MKLGLTKVATTAVAGGFLGAASKFKGKLLNSSKSGLGDLTKAEAKQIQSVVNQAERHLEVRA